MKRHFWEAVEAKLKDEGTKTQLSGKQMIEYMGEKWQGKKEKLDEACSIIKELVSIYEADKHAKKFVDALDEATSKICEVMLNETFKVPDDDITIIASSKNVEGEVVDEKKEEETEEKEEVDEAKVEEKKLWKDESVEEDLTIGRKGSGASTIQKPIIREKGKEEEEEEKEEEVDEDSHLLRLKELAKARRERVSKMKEGEIEEKKEETEEKEEEKEEEVDEDLTIGRKGSGASTIQKPIIREKGKEEKEEEKTKEEEKEEKEEVDESKKETEEEKEEKEKVNERAKLEKKLAKIEENIINRASEMVV